MTPESGKPVCPEIPGKNRYAPRSGVQEQLHSEILSLTEDELRLVIRLLAASQI